MTNHSLLYFVWEDQSAVTCCIFYIVPINYITVLYESYSTVMWLNGQIQSSIDMQITGKYSTVMQHSYVRSAMKTTSLRQHDQSCV